MPGGFFDNRMALENFSFSGTDEFFALSHEIVYKSITRHKDIK